MNRDALFAKLDDIPVIAAVKSGEELTRALESDCGVVFVLSSDILTVADTVSAIKAADKAAFVHVDLVHGLAPREIAIDYIARNTRADGIISTKPALVRYAKAKGLLTVQRYFLLDSIALSNVLKQIDQDCADMVEVLPGVMPKIIRRIASSAQNPLIAGGLIGDKEDVMGALGAGAVAVSTTNPEVWFL